MNTLPSITLMGLILLVPTLFAAETQRCGTSQYACLGLRLYSPCTIFNNGDFSPSLLVNLECDEGEVCVADTDNSFSRSPCIPAPPPCLKQGVFPMTLNPRGFYECSSTGEKDSWEQHVGICSPGSRFNSRRQQCDRD